MAIRIIYIASPFDAGQTPERIFRTLGIENIQERDSDEGARQLAQKQQAPAWTGACSAMGHTFNRSAPRQNTSASQSLLEFSWLRAPTSVPGVPLLGPILA